MTTLSDEVWVFLLCFFFLAQTACQLEPVSSSEGNINPAETSSTPVPANSPEKGAVDGQEVPPVAIGRVVKGKSKPPTFFYSFELEFKGQRDGYAWLLVRDKADRPLRKTGVFDGYFDIPFGSSAYPGPKQDKVVIVTFSGKDRFRAIRLPETGTIKFDKFVQYTNSDVSEFEAWEVRTLLVNGKTPLEKWLPYDTASDATRQALDQHGSNQVDLGLDRNTNTSRTDYPKEEVKFVEAQGIRKWAIPFKLSTATE